MQDFITHFYFFTPYFDEKPLSQKFLTALLTPLLALNSSYDLLKCKTFRIEAMPELCLSAFNPSFNS